MGDEPQMMNDWWLTRLGKSAAFWWALLSLAALVIIGSVVQIVLSGGRSGLWWTVGAMLLLTISCVMSLVRITRERSRAH